MRRLFVLCLGILAGPVCAQDEEDVVDAVAEVVTALRKADSTRFAELAANDEPDPWLVADSLLRKGERDLAMRFATAKPRPAVRGLPEYLRTNPEPTDAATAAITLAQLRLEDDRATKAQLEGAIRTLTSAAAGATPMERARIHSLLGMAHAYAGDVAASSRELGSAATLAEKIGWVREGADALGTASENARVLLRYDEAIQIARRELALRRKLGDEARIVAHLQRLAQLFDENGDLPAAMRELDGWAGKLSPEANTELAISRANLRMQQVALSEALEVLRADARPQNADQGGRVTMLAGDILRQQGSEAEALKRYREAAASFEETKDAIQIGRALGNAGISLVRLGKPEQARALLEKAQAQFETAKDRSLVALAVLFRGDAHLAAGEHALALRLFNSARTFAERTGDAWLEANALVRRGRALLAGGQIDDARRAFSACHELGKRVRAPELEAEGAVGEARCLLRQAHGTRAAEAADRAFIALAPLVDGQAVPAGDEARRIFDLIAAARVEAALLQGSDTDVWRAIELQRLGLQIHTAREAQLLRQSAMTAAMRKAETDARNLIQRATLFEDRAREEEDRATAVQWKARRQQAERDLEKVIDSVMFGAQPGWERLVPSPVALNNLRERLTPTEVLVSYAVTEGPAAAVVISRAEVRLVRLAQSATIRNADKSEQGRLLIDPLKLRKSQARVILILPPELLGVSFGALEASRSHVRMPSGTEFDRMRGRHFRKGKGTITDWAGDERARFYVGRAPTVQAVEDGRTAADVVILTEPIDSPALPRAFYLRGSPTLVVPRKAVDQAVGLALAKNWDPKTAPGPDWIVWSR